MAVLSIYPGGISGGFAGPGREPDDGGMTRGVVCGWSVGASRRLLRWLLSMNVDALDRSDGWAVTLTLKECPADSEEWVAARQELLLLLRNRGAELVHWVTEWTRRGVPHLHLAVYGPGSVDAFVLGAWVTVTRARGWEISARSQHIVRIDGAQGWLEYISKHAARGVHHYQREGHPDGWLRTGRLWGHRGPWPVADPMVLDLERHEFHEYRRLVRSYTRHRLKARGVRNSVVRRVGSNYGDKERGALMGVSGWIPDEISTRLLETALAKAPSIDYRNWE